MILLPFNSISTRLDSILCLYVIKCSSFLELHCIGQTRSSSKGQGEAIAAQQLLDAPFLEGLVREVDLLGRGGELSRAFRDIEFPTVGMIAAGSQIEVSYAVLQANRVSPELVDDVLVFLVLGDDLLLADNAVAGDGSPPPVSAPSVAIDGIVDADAVGRRHAETPAGGVHRRAEAAHAIAFRDAFAFGDAVVGGSSQIRDRVRKGLPVAVVGLVVVRVSVRGGFVALAFLEDQNLADALPDLELAMVVDQLPEEILLFGCRLLLDPKELHELLHGDAFLPVGDPKIVGVFVRVVLDLLSEVSSVEFQKQEMFGHDWILLFVSILLGSLVA